MRWESDIGSFSMGWLNSPPKVMWVILGGKLNFEIGFRNASSYSTNVAVGGMDLCETTLTCFGFVILHFLPFGILF